jgi:hypothetical protein
MAIINEKIEGSKIYNRIQSSNISETEYDVELNNLVVKFNNGLKYEYFDVPHNIYTQFRLSESQGKFFVVNISKKFKYKKIE